jgi:hypothetical protein
MIKWQKTKLRFGPYQPPKTRPGRTLFCEIRGTVVVGGFHDGQIPWPYARLAAHPLIVCGDLVRAIRREAAIAVACHWDVVPGVVMRWRRALGVLVKRKNACTEARDCLVPHGRPIRTSSSELEAPEVTQEVVALPQGAGAIGQDH